MSRPRPHLVRIAAAAVACAWLAAACPGRDATPCNDDADCPPRTEQCVAGVCAPNDRDDDDDADDAGTRADGGGDADDAGLFVDGGGAADAGAPFDAGVGDDAGVTDADAGALDDAGAAGDAGAVGDAGTVDDAGTIDDAGVLHDAGALDDAGKVDDAGALAPDGGVIDDDAGETILDAGTVDDAGAADAGCGDPVVVIVPVPLRQTSEAGATTNVELDVQPAGFTVEVTLSVSDATEAVVKGSTIYVVAPTLVATSIFVTVDGVQDQVQDGVQAYEIVVTARDTRCPGVVTQTIPAENAPSEGVLFRSTGLVNGVIDQPGLSVAASADETCAVDVPGSRAVLFVPGERTLAVDWVLAPLVAYFRADGTYVTTTSPTGVLPENPGDWAVPITTTPVDYWTGFSPVMGEGSTCSGWTSVAGEGSTGNGLQLGQNGYSAGLSVCTAGRPLLCVWP